MKLLFSCAILTLALCAGCVQFQYEGETFPPLAGDVRVKVWVDAEQVNPLYKKIGVLTFEAPAGSTSGEVRAMLRDEALKRGADGALILKMKRISAGEAREDQIQNLNAPTWNPEDNSATSATFMRDTILYSTGRDPEHNIYKTLVEAELLRKQ